MWQMSTKFDANLKKYIIYGIIENRIRLEGFIWWILEKA